MIELSQALREHAASVSRPGKPREQVRTGLSSVLGTGLDMATVKAFLHRKFRDARSCRAGNCSRRCGLSTGREGNISFLFAGVPRRMGSRAVGRVSWSFVRAYSFSVTY